MRTLTRTIRFCINPGEGPVPPVREENGFGGIPAMRGMGRFYELHITCRAEPDPHTGFLVDIKAIDAAARMHAVPLIAEACRDRPRTEPAIVLVHVARALRRRLGPMFHSVRWSLTPYYSLEMADNTSYVLLRQWFDLSAAHRLNVPMLGDERNAEIFGKCNNPAGHGHNYRVEPCVKVLLDPAPTFTLAALETLVQAHIIDRFDHKNLNEDTPEFSSRFGVNPTVENIARQFYEILSRPINEHSRGGAELKALTVWETDRTCATYPG